MIGRMRRAARLGKAEAGIRRILEEEGLAGEVNVRSLDGRLAASVILPAEAAIDEKALEAKLRAGSDADRVTVVKTTHGAPPPMPRPELQGGHSDPLRIGSTPRTQKGPSRPEGVGAVIAVASGKGGVGKSTVAAGLALELTRLGKRVGLLDLDIHGPSLPVLFPVEERLRSEEGQIVPAEAAELKLVSLGYMVDERSAVAWRGPMVMNAARQLIEDTAWGGLDILVVDTPPGTGDAHLSMVQRLRLDAAVLVATPSPLATADVRRGAELFRKVGVPVSGVVLNMTGGPLGNDLDPGLLGELGLEVLERLPLDAETARVPLHEEGGVRLPHLTEKLLQSLAMPRDSAGGTL